MYKTQEIYKALKNAGYRVTLVSNFSYLINKYYNFLEVVVYDLHTMSAERLSALHRLVFDTCKVTAIINLSVMAVDNSPIFCIYLANPEWVEQEGIDYVKAFNKGIDFIKQDAISHADFMKLNNHVCS